MLVLKEGQADDGEYADGSRPSLDEELGRGLEIGRASCRERV
jgi:hypothetical protein